LEVIDGYGREHSQKPDYILVNKKYKNAFSSVKTYPGADLQSDHNQLDGIFRVRMKKVRRKQEPKYDLQKTSRMKV